MEMTYGGALVMPSSYAMMDEEEMMYLEGGKEPHTWYTWPFAIAIDVVFAVIGGFNISAIGTLSSLAIKNLVKKNWTTLGKRALEGVTAGVTGALSSLIGSVNIAASILTSATSIGGLVGLFMDATDKKLDGQFTFYL